LRLYRDKSFVVKKKRINHEDHEEKKKIIDLEIRQRLFFWVAGKARAAPLWFVFMNNPD